MMRQFMTTTVEQRKDFTGDFDTHPMEGAWAGEAIFFLTIESLPQAGTVLNVRLQMSADGVAWIDEGSSFPDLREVGHYIVRVRQFGGGLLLKGRVQQRSEAEDESAAAVPATANLSVHLALKV